MLHILWGILKIIFILIGILVGLAAVVLFLVLFCPIRYHFAGNCEESKAAARAGASWLFHLICISAIYEERNFSYQICILGVSLETYQKLITKFTNRKKNIQKNKTKKRLSEEPCEKKEQEEKQKPTGKREALPEPVNTPKRDEEESAPPSFWRKIKTFFLWIGRLFCRIFTAVLRGILFIWHIPGRIYQGICKIALTISGFCGNIEKWKRFIENERVRAALGLVLGKTKRLLRHVFPTKTQGWILFGFEDPSMTGQALAFAGMTCPLHKNKIELRPVFDKKIFEADIKLRGRIRLFVILKEGLELYFDKNVKYMIKAWKKED